MTALAAFMKFSQPFVQALSIAFLGGITLSHPNAWTIGTFIFVFALHIERHAMSITEKIEENRPKGKSITITRDQLDEHPDIVAEHLRIVTKIEDYITDQKQTARAQNRMADDLDNGVYDETLGKVDVEKMPPQAYRAAARANQRAATYLHRTLNPDREEAK